MNFNFISSLKNRTGNETFIWLCNIGAEQFWHNQIDLFQDKTDMSLVHSMEEINLLLCRKQDTIILRNMPDPEYLKNAEKYGFAIPNILCPRNKETDLSISELVLQDEQLLGELKKIRGESVYFVPYAVTSLEEQIAEICGLSLIGANSEICRKVNDKIFARKIAETLQFPMTEGAVCTTLDEILPYYLDLLASNSGTSVKVVLKNPYNASGKGMYIAENEKQIKTIVSILKRSKASGSWILEKWYENKMDISYQIFISPDGRIDLFSVTRQFVNKTVYIGTMIPHGLTRDTLVQLESYGRKIGEYLFSVGYTGIAGIDAIITENQVIPIIEINARFTLSTYLYLLPDHFHKKHILFRYFDIAANIPVSYQSLLNLIKKKISSQPEVFVFAPSLLPKQRLTSSGWYKGRVFVLFCDNDIERIWQGTEQFQECIVKKLMHNEPEAMCNDVIGGKK